jgi:hypothetical protein
MMRPPPLTTAAFPQLVGYDFPLLPPGTARLWREPLFSFDRQSLQGGLTVCELEAQHPGAAALIGNFAAGDPFVDGAQTYAEMDSDADTVGGAVGIEKNIFRLKSGPRPPVEVLPRFKWPRRRRCRYWRYSAADFSQRPGRAP